VNYRIFILITMAALAIQACQGSKNTEKAARPAAPKEGSKDGADASQKALDGMKGACQNPVEMSVQSGEKEIKLKDLLKEKQGTYELISFEQFVETENEKGNANNLHFIGSEMTVEKNLKEEVSADDKIEIICTTKPQEGQALIVSGNASVPNAFETPSGAVHAYRRDQVKVDSGKAQMLSAVFPKEAKIGDSNRLSPGGKSLIVRKDDNTFTLKIQYSTTDTNQKRVRITTASTYRLQK